VDPAPFRVNGENRYHGYDALVTASYLDFLSNKGKATMLANGRSRPSRRKWAA
jgi:hypothetical protein